MQRGMCDAWYTYMIMIQSTLCPNMQWYPVFKTLNKVIEALDQSLFRRFGVLAFSVVRLLLFVASPVAAVSKG